MVKKLLLYLRKSDWPLSSVVLFLVAFGLMALYSIESAVQDPQFANLQKQLIFLAVGIVFLAVFSMIDYRHLQTYSIVLLVFGALLLASVLFFGTTVRGTRGWFTLFGGQGFQPVELIKLILIIGLSKFFADWRTEVQTIKQLVILFAVAIPLIALVLLQPDFGSAVILAAIFLGMLVFSKVKRSYVIGIGLLLIVLVGFSWAFLLQDYQKDRILTFMDPGRDPYKSGYNIKQSIIAVGSGSIFGRGLGLGPQSRLNFLPAQETDFIFAVIAEELGFVGSSLLILSYVWLIYRLVRIARLIRDDFGIFVVTGILIYITAQGILNIGMNIGLLPIAGVPLPFVSYGGSSMISSFIAVGIVQSVYIRHLTSRA
ncbi:MAG: rod shape-determining protein RodA [Patescibacteria group bacterium]